MKFKATSPTWLYLLGVLCSMFLAAAPAPAESGDLEAVLKRMDQTAATFRSAQAKFTWIQYNSVVNDIADTQTGVIYFRRSDGEIQMAADIAQPDQKQVMFSHGKIQIFQTRTGTVDVYDAGSHREEFESFLVLGFGGGGHEMLKSFEVKYLKEEALAGVHAAELDLIPKSEKVKQMFSHIQLWISIETGLSVQQQLFQSNGDYRLAKYSAIQLNHKISENAFKLKTPASARVVTH
ncbi:MAG: outer membrane lipoprotein-sorting protein [Acidobacteria bacterium]|nr:outer membrane lipoprotein-sorting protein [Acidobacteriota bacterium]